MIIRMGASAGVGRRVEEDMEMDDDATEEDIEAATLEFATQAMGFEYWWEKVS